MSVNSNGTKVAEAATSSSLSSLLYIIYCAVCFIPGLPFLYANILWKPLNICRSVYILQNTGWSHLIAGLPNGINQILIDGYIRELGTHHSVLLDDVNIQNCEHFSEYVSFFGNVLEITKYKNGNCISHVYINVSYTSDDTLLVVVNETKPRRAGIPWND